MSYWTHYAHMQTITVSKGDVVRQGQQIGTLGGTGGWTPHLHFEVRTKDFPIADYTKGMTKDQVLDRYTDPLALIGANKLSMPCRWNAFGWNWLEWADYGTFQCYHPGVDLNWGYGDQDLGEPIYAIADGVVSDVKLNAPGGWGNHLLIKHEEEAFMQFNLYRIKGTETVYYQIFPVLDGLGFGDSLLIPVRSAEEFVSTFGPSAWGRIKDVDSWAGIGAPVTDIVAGQNAKISSLQSEVDQLTAKVADSSNSINLYDAKCTDLGQRLDVANGQITALQAQIDALNVQLSKATEVHPSPVETAPVQPSKPVDSVTPPAVPPAHEVPAPAKSWIQIVVEAIISIITGKK